jgi:hypothetical protein
MIKHDEYSQAFDEYIESYILKFWDREKITEFCLRLMGDEARAWWARKQGHQS